MAILKRIINILANLSYILIGIYAIVSIPGMFGYKPLIVLSGSMEPTYKVGSIIYYHSVAKTDIKEQDVITFMVNDEIVTHRVNRIEEDNFYTKGDANETEDVMPTTYSNIQGKVISLSIPYIGYYIKFINDNLYLIIPVVIILLLEFILSNGKKEVISKNE